MKAVVCACGWAVALAAGAADPFATPEAAANAAMDRVMTALWDPGTGCVYDFIASNRLGEVSYRATMPTPEEVKLNFPNPNGWRMGMEDCPLKGGTMLAAALARLEAHGGKDDVARDVVEKVYKGLRNCATISGISGFVARGVLPTDGKSFYINSSRDQYTLFVYLLWRYYRSGFADEARKAEIRQMLVDVAAHLKRCLEDPKCEMTLTRADGRPGDVGYMWVKDTRKEVWEGDGLMCSFDGLMCPHEAFRTAMFFAAAWDVSGDAKWRAEQQKYMPEAFHMTGPKYVPYGFDLPVFALFQAQVSHRLLWEVEPDPATKARLADVMERFAKMSESVQDSVERAWSKLTPEVFAQPADDWRAAKFIYRSGRRGGQPPGELISGLPYMIPLITGYWNKSYIGEALGAGLLCRMLSPRTPVPPSEIDRFNRLLVAVDWSKNIASAVSHTVYAYWAVRCGLHRRPSATNEWDYVRRKWREDLSDPSTGLGALALRAETAALVSNALKTAGWPMTKAIAFTNLCERTAIDVSGWDWFPTFAYWTRHTTDLHPLIPRTNEQCERIRLKHYPHVLPDWPNWTGYQDFDHSAPWWEDILKLGFPGMARRLQDHWKDTEYYRIRKIAADGILRLLDRLVEQGKSRLASGTVGESQTARSRISQQVESLKRLRAGAPQTAYDVLNFVYLYFVISENFEGIQVRTLGNLDRMLTPYYRADLKAGRTTEAEFRSQLKHFWWQWGSLDNYWGQPVYFGGTEADGTTVYSEVSKILLDVHDELALATPKVHLKVGKSTPDWLWRKAIDMSRRMRPLSYLGEEPHRRVIRSLGYSETEAREFAVWGCYEWAIRDSANDTCGAAVNLLRPVERLLAEAAEGRFAVGDFAAFKRAYLERSGTNVVAARTFAFEGEKYLDLVNPSLLFSLATAHSVETGKDAYRGGMRSGNNTGIWMIGLASTVDALLAVKEIVYERGELSLAELGKLMAADWKGREDLRLRMSRSPRKWGNNDPDANAIGREVVAHVSGLVTGVPNSRGGVFKASGHTARWHYGYGRATGATPDGRRKGEEISKNVSPTMGADTEGATALVATLGNLDARQLPGDFPLDVALLPWTVQGEKGIDTIRTLIETYFANGGLVIQFNILDPETLREAQRHPEKYENLQVRVCGWNVRWNDIPKHEQDKFILRQERIR